VVVAPLTLAEFNAAAESVAHGVLGSCLDVERWVLEVAEGRPYPDGESLRARAAASADAITWDEVAGALARHPRIGEQAGGDPGDAALSASEQAGVSSSDAAALAAGNAAYERRFGYIYLICATGLSGQQMLTALQDRLTHDDEAEHLVVMDELRKISALRLAKAIR
jgi:2-oxo-4-hydroxy-4-carboxy-5-ureidoimidazoline decarboxylase